MAYWPSVAEDVRAHCVGCSICQQRKRSKHSPQAPMQETEVPVQPFDKISVDFLGPLPETTEGYKYVLQIQDVISRYSMFIATKDETVQTAAQCIVRNWCCTFDIPKRLGSDNGPHFASTILQTVCEQLGIIMNFSSPYHPQTQGQVERQNDTFTNSLATLAAGNPDSWPTLLPMVNYAMNSSPSAATGISPHEMVFKQPPNRPEKFLFPPEEGEEEEEYTVSKSPQTKLAETVRSKAKQWEKVIRLVRRNIKKQQKKRIKKTAERVNHQPFEINDLVKKKLHGQKGKLQLYYSSPYIVVNKKGPVTYGIRKADDETAREEVRHYNELLPWHSQTLKHEREMAEQEDDSESEEECQQPVQTHRTSTRVRKATEVLQVDGNKKTYTSQLTRSVESSDED